jgi:cytochrome c biogenesis protein CcdA/glutaredoxin
MIDEKRHMTLCFTNMDNLFYNRDIKTSGVVMKKYIYIAFIIITVFLGVLYQQTPLTSQAAEETYDVVYFGSRYCQVCQALENSDDIFSIMEDQGLTVKKYILEDDSSYTELFRNYQFTYDVPQTSSSVPIIFVGKSYFSGRTDIVSAVEDFTVLNLANTETMPEILTAPPSDFSLIYFILLGFVDGVNPCAIAMLLIFISMLGFTKKKRVLVMVSLTFISAIFISYFLFGTILYNYLNRLQFLSFLVQTVPWIIIGLTGILFILNFYDFVVTILQKYQLVKNQLPSGIQRFNRKLIEKFTKTMEEDSKKVYVVTFIIGLIISFTEFLCTGQAYLTAILHLIHFTDHLWRGIILLLVYNLIFVLPLFIITLIAVKTQSIMSISNFMREKLHWIKLFNALVFLAILIYYLIFMI